MKYLLGLIFVLLSIQTCFGQSNKFYDTVLNYEKCRYCYFLSIDVESEKYKGKVVIENDDLYSFLSKTRGFNKNQYKEFMKDLLSNNKKLGIENASLDKTGFFINIKGISENNFRVVKDANDVEDIAAKGCVPIIVHYFLGQTLESIGNFVSEDCGEYVKKQKDNLLLINHVGIREQNAIISRLFEWQIPVRIDDLSGLLIIKPASIK